MKILLTGSSGRIGRAIFAALTREHEVIGLDRNVFSTTRIVGDCADPAVIKPALEGVDAVIHTAGPHAPHVDVVPDAEFERTNAEGTRLLYEAARAHGVSRFVYTSTTALYGNAIEPEHCTWVDENTEPKPKSIYHRTKLAAEARLSDMASDRLPVRVIRMSRCFPETADLMAPYRLHRGVDARDVALAHALALDHEGPAFERFIISGTTPFQPEDCAELAKDPRSVLARRAPGFLAAMDARGWPIPQAIDRVYASQKAIAELGWKPCRGWEEVMAQADRDDLEVLPVGTGLTKTQE